MGNQLNKIDDLFSKSLTDHKLAAGDLAWEKIDKRLNKRRAPIWIIWGQWSVAAAVALSAISLYLFQPEIEQQTTPYSTETNSDISSESLADLSGDEILSEQIKPVIKSEVTESKQKANNLIAGRIEDNKEEKIATIPEKERSLETKAITAEKLYHMDMKASPKVNLPIHGITVNSGQLAQSENESVTDNDTEDYKIKIVSRGYAFAPEKENLVEEIESKIGGFLHKVDQGFSGIQDKKDLLFASLTSKNNEKNR